MTRELATVALLSAAALAITAVAQETPRTVRLKAGMVIDRSVRIEPGTYRVPSASIDRPAVVVRGSRVSVDMTGVTLEGGEPFATPDSYTGMGIFVDAAADVTIRGATIRGYKIGILANRAPRLHLTRNDLSYNWKPRLKSGIEQEHQSDWLSFHDNEKSEWLRYGAAIYLHECDDAEIDRNRAVQGMNGLLVTRSSRLQIWNNTFSWLSGVGIGLYRTADSQIRHNKLDWCVRGYSHGYYNRGQDSAGLLMYEQSSRNVVAFNSITHGGDGVFLWAGQSTMDTGKGGSDDNLFYENDVSHAVANGIEATFSRNRIVRNRIDESWHGIWGGYSHDTLIAGNTFAGNDEGIAIEHGQNITIRGNTFRGDTTGIRLWANTQQDPNWGYPKFRDTRSRDYVIFDNRFDGVAVGTHITRTAGIRFAANTLTNVTQSHVWGDGAPAITTDDRLSDISAAERGAAIADPPSPAPGGINAKLPDGARRGRDTIIVDEWGPYDYRSPKLWPASRPGDRPVRLRILGPEGRWTLSSLRGAVAAAKSGTTPGELLLTPSGPGTDLTVELTYLGREVISPRGEWFAAGRPYRFGFAMFEPAIDWTVRFWKLDPGLNPLTQLEVFRAKLKTPPARTETLRRLVYANARSFGEGFTDRIGIVAEGTVEIASGRYELAVTSDDGVRVWVDGRLVLEDWSIHGPKEDRVPLTGGRHRLRIEYFQHTGAAALMVKVIRP